MEKDFFEMITEYFINDRLGDILMQDQEFVKLQNEIWKHMEQFEKEANMGEQHLAVEKLILLHTKSIDFYAKKSYEYGFRDCISALRKLELLKTL